MFDMLVLVVQFTSGQFSGSELSESIEVVLEVTGRTSSNPITVTVTPSPVSGMDVCCIKVYNRIEYVFLYSICYRF